MSLCRAVLEDHNDGVTALSIHALSMLTLASGEYMMGKGERQNTNLVEW
jgi:hypothetical protein